MYRKVAKDEQFGLLTAIWIDPARKDMVATYWMCRCTCGGHRSVRDGALMDGSVRGCRTCHRLGKCHSIKSPRKPRHLGEFKVQGGNQSVYMQFWKRFLREFTEEERLMYDEIMSGRDPSDRNCAEAVDVVKREFLVREGKSLTG